jgi:hypothetical protein
MDIADKLEHDREAGVVELLPDETITPVEELVQPPVAP